MYVRREISASIIWHFAWRSVCFFIFISVVAVFAYTELHLTFIAVPFLPVATVGTAVAFYAGFKNNASYERLWEGRKIWAEIEHLSRYAAMLVLKSTHTTSSDARGVAASVRKFIYAQIAWTSCLRSRLRMTPTFVGVNNEALDQVKLLEKSGVSLNLQEEISRSLGAFLSQDEVARVLKARNVPTEILFEQMRNLDAMRADGLSEADYIKLLDILSGCSQQQAAAERLNSFPFPRQYAHFSSVFVNIFVVLLPFSLLNELKTANVNLWLVVPFSVLVSWVFYTMERVGDTSENPFENALNDVPMSTICREIEIDLKHMLGETELPEVLIPERAIMM